MRKFLVSLIAAMLVFAGVPRTAQAAPVTGLAAETWSSASVGPSSTTIQLNSPASNITIWNTSATSTVYVTPISPATTANFPIGPGASFSFDVTVRQKLYAISSSGTVTVGVCAH